MPFNIIEGVKDINSYFVDNRYILKYIELEQNDQFKYNVKFIGDNILRKEFEKLLIYPIEDNFDDPKKISLSSHYYQINQFRYILNLSLSHNYDNIDNHDLSINYSNYLGNIKDNIKYKIENLDNSPESKNVYDPNLEDLKSGYYEVSVLNNDDNVILDSKCIYSSRNNTILIKMYKR